MLPTPRDPSEPSSKRYLSLTISAILAFVCSSGLVPAYAGATMHQVCTNEQAQQAALEADELKTWDSVHRSFKRFGRCAEGPIAEEYTDSIARLLAHDWNHLDDLVRLTSSDHEFERFVIEHIDESMTEDDAILIVNNARLHCPRSATRLCKLIAD